MSGFYIFRAFALSSLVVFIAIIYQKNLQLPLLHTKRYNYNVVIRYTRNCRKERSHTSIGDTIESNLYKKKRNCKISSPCIKSKYRTTTEINVADLCSDSMCRLK